jgi:hypothetical protein
VPPTDARDWACALLPIAILGLMAAVSWATRRWVFMDGTRYRAIEDLVGDLEQKTGLHGAWRGPGRWLHDLELLGKLASGRFAQVSFPQEGKGKGRREWVRLSVAADEAPALEVKRESWGVKLEKMLAIVRDDEIGDPAFDRRFIVRALPGTARDAFRAGLKDAVERLFAAFPVEALELGNGTLSVLLPRHDVPSISYAPILDALDAAARPFDRVGLHVRVLGGERRALRAAAGGARCGYCHETVTGIEPDLVACEKCQTVIHDACWRELGRCPVLGCRGAAPERARV